MKRLRIVCVPESEVQGLTAAKGGRTNPAGRVYNLVSRIRKLNESENNPHRQLPKDRMRGRET